MFVRLLSEKPALTFQVVDLTARKFDKLKPFRHASRFFDFQSRYFLKRNYDFIRAQAIS